MKKQILFSILTIGIMAAFLSGGTFAYFIDTETSSNNTFTAGTLDITLSSWGSWDFPFDNMAPGDITDLQRKLITSTGTLTPDHLEIQITTSNFIDGGIGPGNDEDAFEKQIEVTRLHIQNKGGGGFNNLLSLITDDDGDGVISLYDLEEYGVIDDISLTNNEMVFKVEFKFVTNAGNEYQGDSIDIDFAFGAAQVTGQDVL